MTMETRKTLYIVRAASTNDTARAWTRGKEEREREREDAQRARGARRILSTMSQPAEREQREIKASLQYHHHHRILHPIDYVCILSPALGLV